MNWRRRFLFVWLAAVVVGLAVGLWALWPRSAITRENAGKISDGMSLQEVERILGGPPRDETNGGYRAVQYRLTTTDFYGAPPARCKEWIGPQSCVLIVLGEDGHVVSTTVGVTHLRDETMLQKICRCIGL